MENNFPKSREEEMSQISEKNSLDHPGRPPFEYNRITDNIYIGTNMCCQMHFDKDLSDKGITADISLEAEKVDQPFGVDFYTWIPIKNHEAPTMEQVELFISTLEKLLSEKKKVYVHCKNGHGRAPTMVAAYFIYKGMSAARAITKVKERRPSIHLDEAQKEFLERYSEKLGK